MAQKGKTKGNAEERKIAKMISQWFFNDQYVLKRSSDSGALKTTYCGDVVPAKQLIDFWTYGWPFTIEVKTGYEQHLPTFYNSSQVVKWFHKAYKESFINNQNTVLLITRFKHKKPLLFVNYYITQILFNVIVPLHLKSGELIPIFVYDFYTLLSHPYDSVFNMEQICCQ